MWIMIKIIKFSNNKSQCKQNTYNSTWLMNEKSVCKCIDYNIDTSVFS